MKVSEFCMLCLIRSRQQLQKDGLNRYFISLKCPRDACLAVD